MLGLGFAGIDPLGLSFLVAALTAGAKKPHVIAFCLATLAGTVFIGVVVSVLGKQVTDQIIAFIPDIDDPAWAVIELIVAALIVYWLISEIGPTRESEAPADAKLPQRTSVIGMLFSGVAFSAVTVLDPTFFATAAITSQIQSILPLIGLFTVWLLASQVLLFSFALAYVLDVHQPLTDFAKSIWDKVKRPVKWLFFLALIIVAVGLTADALSLFITGEYLI